jgi:hypothetical protein
MKLTRIALSKLPKQIRVAQVKQSLAYLRSRQSELSAFPSLEDLILTWDEIQDPRLKGFDHHFTLIRNRIARKLWSESAFIGFSVIESLLFQSLKNPSVGDPIQAVFDDIRNFGLHRNGFILYPLHSFGILDVGIGQFFSLKTVHVILPDAGIAISPQTNSEDGLLEFLKTATKQLGIRHAIPKDRMDHLLRSGKSGILKWMTQNPILLVRSRVFSGSYFENQFLLVIKLKIALAFATMLYSFQKKQGEVGARKLFSTSNLNNFETLDIRHYLVFQSPVGYRKFLSVDRVPMNASKPELAELSELDIELDPREWRRRSEMLERIRKALATVETGYFAHCMGSLVDTTQRRVFLKIFDAINYFRRSFRESAKEEPNIISLTIAFETLLTDCYSPGVADRIAERVGILVKGIPGARKMKSAVKDLYNARNESVHTGTTDIVLDWPACRRAFTHSLINLCKRLKKLPKTSSAPIGDVLNN